MNITSDNMMIGNVLFNPVTNKNVIVDGSMIALEAYREKFDKNHKGFEGIEITEEKLLKLGFKKDGNTYTAKKEFTIELINDEWNIVDFYEMPMYKIRFIHELQNLYTILFKTKLL